MNIIHSTLVIAESRVEFQSFISTGTVAADPDRENHVRANNVDPTNLSGFEISRQFEWIPLHQDPAPHRQKPGCDLELWRKRNFLMT